jgi:4a-hydroxytetrahydrobiopterin dehydratase
MLTEEQLAAALVALPGWQQGDRQIRKVYDFASFPAAMRFVHRVADLAEARNHHPDIVIEYRRVTLGLHSHDAGGVTKRDIGLAHAIDDE